MKGESTSTQGTKYEIMEKCYNLRNKIKRLARLEDETADVKSLTEWLDGMDARVHNAMRKKSIEAIEKNWMSEMNEKEMLIDKAINNAVEKEIARQAKAIPNEIKEIEKKISELTELLEPGWNTSYIESKVEWIDGIRKEIIEKEMREMIEKGLMDQIISEKKI